MLSIAGASCIVGKAGHILHVDVTYHPYAHVGLWYMSMLHFRAQVL